MDAFTESEFYQEHFDGRQFLKCFYSFPIHPDDAFSFILCQLAKTFSSGNFKGNKLIDIGSGPTIHCLVSASKCYEEIVVSDFTDSNRREIERWLRNEEGCIDWSSTIQFVCEMEGKSRSPAEVEQRLRKIVKQVLKCDVRQENPFHPLKMEPADCILSSFCLETACKDLEMYHRALKSIAALLKPGGILVLIGTLNQSSYHVGGHKFSTLNLSQSFIEETVGDLGFCIEQLNLCPPNGGNTLPCDSEDYFYLVARKKCN